MVVCAATLATWAALATVHGLFSDLPLLVALPLLTLAAGYEVVWSLHVGVERIGRFIQVAYEGRSDGPSWETVTMRAAPGLPGSGVNPLFTVLFMSASLTNLGTAFVSEPAPIELILLFACHTAFILRLAQTRFLAGRQRRTDLAMFQAAIGALSDATAPLAAGKTSSETEKS